MKVGDIGEIKIRDMVEECWQSLLEWAFTCLTCPSSRQQIAELAQTPRSACSDGSHPCPPATIPAITTTVEPWRNGAMDAGRWTMEQSRCVISLIYTIATLTTVHILHIIFGCSMASRGMSQGGRGEREYLSLADLVGTHVAGVSGLPHEWLQLLVSQSLSLPVSQSWSLGLSECVRVAAKTGRLWDGRGMPAACRST